MTALNKMNFRKLLGKKKNCFDEICNNFDNIYSFKIKNRIIFNYLVADIYSISSVALAAAVMEHFL